MYKPPLKMIFGASLFFGLLLGSWMFPLLWWVVKTFAGANADKIYETYAAWYSMLARIGMNEYVFLAIGGFVFVTTLSFCVMYIGEKYNPKLTGRYAQRYHNRRR